jgi:hypothetical protein
MYGRDMLDNATKSESRRSELGQWRNHNCIHHQRQEILIAFVPMKEKKSYFSLIRGGRILLSRGQALRKEIQSEGFVTGTSYKRKNGDCGSAAG